MDKLDQIKKKIEEYQNKSAVTGDLKAFITLVLGVVKTAKENFDKTSKENIQVIQEAVNYIGKEHSKLLKDVSQETESVKDEFKTSIKEVEKLIKDLKAIEYKDGEDGYTPVKGVDYYTDEEIKELKDDLSKSIPLELTGEKIVDKINELDLTPENQIDASHIKNLPKPEIVKGGGVRFLQYLADVSIQNPTDGQVLTWDGTNNRWNNEASAGGGAVDSVNGQTGVVVLDADDIDDTSTTNKFNITHTGDVTGASALTIDKTAITGKTAVTALGTDYVLISDTSDSGNLKKALVSDLTGSGSVAWGGITGTLTDQTDLVTELDNRSNLALALAVAL